MMVPMEEILQAYTHRGCSVEMKFVDGTNTPTLFKDFQGGFTTNMGPLAYDQSIVYNVCKLYFSLRDSDNRHELYRSDGTSANTVSFHARSSGNGVYPAFFCIFDGKLYYGATTANEGENYGEQMERPKQFLRILILAPIVPNHKE